MRTTVSLDDRLFRAAKKRAAARGITLSELVNEALMASLAAAAPPPTKFEMVTYGKRASKVRHEPSDFAAVIEEEERRRVRF
jgi:hypothetical protein